MTGRFFQVLGALLTAALCCFALPADKAVAQQATFSCTDLQNSPESRTIGVDGEVSFSLALVSGDTLNFNADANPGPGQGFDIDWELTPALPEINGTIATGDEDLVSQEIPLDDTHSLVFTSGGSDAPTRQINLSCEPAAPVTGSITIKKQSTATAVADFDFTSNLPVDGNLTLTAGNGQDDEKTFDDLEAGQTYTFTELAVTNYELTQLSCSDGTTAPDGNNQVSVTVVAGVNITCTFVNGLADNTEITTTAQEIGCGEHMFRFRLC